MKIGMKIHSKWTTSYAWYKFGIGSSINKVWAHFGPNMGQIWTNIGPKMTPKGKKIANLTQISFKLAKKPHLV